jgi:hypothetical protein
MWRITTYSWAPIAAFVLFAAGPARGFIVNPLDPDPWLVTASSPRGGNGDPATITWSIVPDGTDLDRYSGGGTAPSNLIATLNASFGGNPAQTDLTQQPWFHYLDESFGRWAALGGVTFVYEPEDDGADHPSAAGDLGDRGDIRIGGYSIDGANGIFAFAYLPPGGSDIVFDTSDTAYLGNPSSDYIRLRTVAMHEIGHTIGLRHTSSTSSLLMETTISVSFYGPQLDEVRGVQNFFGDPNEKSNNGLGNDSAALATSLGAILDGGSATVGAAANVPGQAISATATDFVSISNPADADFYSFTVSQSSRLSATLFPRGGVFNQAPPPDVPTTYNANMQNDLQLSILATNGTSILATANAGTAGAIEELENILLPAPGTYFARISGAGDTIQLYQLSLSVDVLLPGDFNSDNVVDAADYVEWSKTGGTPAELATWRTHFGQTLAGGGGGSRTDSATQSGAPEPPASLLAAPLLLAASFCRRTFAE